MRFVFVICILLLTTLNQDETNNFIEPYNDVLGAVLQPVRIHLKSLLKLLDYLSCVSLLPPLYYFFNGRVVIGRLTNLTWKAM